ncbi:MAG: hypothetical protein JRM80_11745 [Nitrososphaerota archaeon]|nr:hypothetical protein [Nitrososphaerota archaeon]
MVVVAVVTKEGCTPCLRVKRIVGELKAELPQIVVREVDFGSSEGVALALEDGILFPPAVLIDGRLFAKGKIVEEQLKEAVRSAARSE